MDYIKAQVYKPNIKKILASDKLNFKGLYSASTGEIHEDKVVAEIHFCKVKVFKTGSVYFSGSIHKMYNSIKGIKAPNYNTKEKDNYKGFNGNQFGLEEILFVIDYLEKLLFQDASLMQIRCIELGLNLPIGFNPRLFIVGLLYLKNTPFEFKYKRNYSQVDFNDFRLKIYNKSGQYGLDNHTLRIEVNFSRMKPLNDIGIKTLAELPKHLNKGLGLVFEKFNNVMYYDETIRVKHLTKPQKKSLAKYKSQRYWLDDLKPNKRFEPKRKLLEIITNHSKNLKEKIRVQFLKSRVTNTRLVKSKNRVTNTHSSIDVFITQKAPKKCRVSGVNISMQKRDSILLSHTGIRHYLKHDIRAFTELKRKFMPMRWNDANIETQIKELAHNIRNISNNQNIKQNRLYTDNQYQLFNLKTIQL